MTILCFMHRDELNNINYDEASFSSNRRLKISRLKNEGSKQLSVCAELALIKALGEYVKQEGMGEIKLPLQITENERGKLFLSEVSPYTGRIFVSISHAKDIAVAAVSDHDLGVDIEEVSRKQPSAVNKILHPENLKQFESLDDEASRKDYFFRKWTAMESYMKLTGQGLYMKTTKIFISPEGTATSSESEITGYITDCTDMIPYEKGLYRCSLCTCKSYDDITVIVQ